MFSLTNLFNSKNFVKPGNFSREDATVWGMMAIFLLLAVLVLWDGYIFYVSVIVERPTGSDLSLKTLSFSERDLNEVIRLLDDRQKKFEALLEVTLLPK